MKNILLFSFFLTSIAPIFSQKTIDLTPIVDDGIGFHLATNAANTNYSKDHWNIAHTQPGGGGIGIDTGRTLILFDFNALPKDIVVKKVALSFFAYPNQAGPTYHGHSGANNAAILQRITQQWTPSKVNWNTRPNTTTENQVVLPKSNSKFQDYLNIDVTNLFLPMIKDKSLNFGIQFKLLEEITTNVMIFCSTNYQDQSKHPKLTIYYEDTAPVVPVPPAATPTTNTKVICDSEEALYTPNSFSPNDDGINDNFTIFSNKDLKINYLRIFDRWGNLLFEKENFLTNDEFQGWNGKVENQPSAIGTYVYDIKITDHKGCTKSMSADLSLLR